MQERASMMLSMSTTPSLSSHRSAANLALIALVAAKLKEGRSVADALLELGIVRRSEPGHAGTIATLDTTRGRATGEHARWIAEELEETFRKYPYTRFGETLVTTGVIRSPVSAHEASKEAYRVLDPFHDDPLEVLARVEAQQHHHAP